MSYGRTSFISFCIIVVFTVRANGGPAAVDALNHLVTSSDVIATGTFEVTNTNGVFSVTLEVLQVLKGRLGAHSGIAFTWSAPSVSPFPSASSATSQTGLGLFFLMQSPSGFAVVPVTVGDAQWNDIYIDMSPLGSQGLTALSPGLSPLQSVLSGLVRVVQAGGRIPFDLVDLFRQTQEPLLAEGFAVFRASQDIQLIALGVEGGLATQDVRSLLYVRDHSSALSKSFRWQMILGEIRFFFNAVQPQAIAALGQIATDQGRDSAQRAAAAGALARTHTAGTLRYLSLLLGEQDVSLQAMAVGGMSSFANNVPFGSHEPAPGPWIYRTDETIAHSAFDPATMASRRVYYVTFWESWIQQNASLLAGQ